MDPNSPSVDESSSYASTSRPYYVARLPASLATPRKARISSTSSFTDEPRIRRRPRRSAYDVFDEISFCNDVASRIADELSKRPKVIAQRRSISIDPWRGSLPDQTYQDVATSESSSRKPVEDDGEATELQEDLDDELRPERTEKTKAAAEAFLKRLQERKGEHGIDDTERELEKHVFALFGDRDGVDEVLTQERADDEEVREDISPHVASQIAHVLQPDPLPHRKAPLIQELQRDPGSQLVSNSYGEDLQDDQAARTVHRYELEPSIIGGSGEEDSADINPLGDADEEIDELDEDEDGRKGQPEFQDQYEDQARPISLLDSEEEDEEVDEEEEEEGEEEEEEEGEQTPDHFDYAHDQHFLPRIYDAESSAGVYDDEMSNTDEDAFDEGEEEDDTSGEPVPQLAQETSSNFELYNVSSEHQPAHEDVWQGQTNPSLFLPSRVQQPEDSTTSNAFSTLSHPFSAADEFYRVAAEAVQNLPWQHDNASSLATSDTQMIEGQLNNLADENAFGVDVRQTGQPHSDATRLQSSSSRDSSAGENNAVVEEDVEVAADGSGDERTHSQRVGDKVSREEGDGVGKETYFVEVKEGDDEIAKEDDDGVIREIIGGMESHDDLEAQTLENVASHLPNHQASEYERSLHADRKSPESNLDGKAYEHAAQEGAKTEDLNANNLRKVRAGAAGARSESNDEGQKKNAVTPQAGALEAPTHEVSMNSTEVGLPEQHDDVQDSTLDKDRETEDSPKSSLPVLPTQTGVVTRSVRRSSEASSIGDGLNSSPRRSRRRSRRSDPDGDLADFVPEGEKRAMRRSRTRTPSNSIIDDEGAPRSAKSAAGAGHVFDQSILEEDEKEDPSEQGGLSSSVGSRKNLLTDMKEHSDEEAHAVEPSEVLLDALEGDSSVYSEELTAKATVRTSDRRARRSANKKAHASPKKRKSTLKLSLSSTSGTQGGDDEATSASVREDGSVSGSVAQMQTRNKRRRGRRETVDEAETQPSSPQRSSNPASKTPPRRSKRRK